MKTTTQYIIMGSRNDPDVVIEVTLDEESEELEQSSSQSSEGSEGSEGSSDAYDENNFHSFDSEIENENTNTPPEP